MPCQNPPGPPPQGGDRRHNPRFSCGGWVQIICLPSDGTLLSGRIRDLSLGGCALQTPAALQCGALVEILARVNASSFRAVGRVKAVRGLSGVGLQFLQLSAGGQDILVELVRELARQAAIAQTVQAAHREPPSDFFARQRAAILRSGIPAGEIVVNVEGTQPESSPPDHRILMENQELDLFI